MDFALLFYDEAPLQRYILMSHCVETLRKEDSVVELA